MMKGMKKEQILIGILAIILIIVVLIPVPEKKSIDTSEILEKEVMPENKISMEQQLKEVLQKIYGVGRVEVFITYEDNGRIMIEKDTSVSEEQIQETDSNGGTRATTTIRNEKNSVYDGTDAPCVIQELSPTVKGVLVVAEGAGNLSIKKQIQETIEALFGLDAHKISIMKMEVSK